MKIIIILKTWVNPFQSKQVVLGLIKDYERVKKMRQKFAKKLLF
jgi:hypothetical protein